MRAAGGGAGRAAMDALCRSHSDGCSTHNGLTFFPVLKAGNNWVRGNVPQLRSTAPCKPAADSFALARHPLDRLMSAFGEAAWRRHVDLSCKRELCVEAFSAPRPSVEEALWRFLLNSSAAAPPHAVHLCPMAPTLARSRRQLRLERLADDWELLRRDHPWLPAHNATRPFGHLSSADPAGYAARFAERSVTRRGELCALLSADLQATGDADCMERRLVASSVRPWPHPRHNRYGDAPLEPQAARPAARPPPPPRGWWFF